MTIQPLQILDVGCGTGFRTHLLSKHGSVVGIDISAELLQTARHNFPSIQFRSMSADALEFPDKSFEEIYCFDVLEHVDRLDSTLHELARTLKFDGHLIVEVPYWRSEILLKKIHAAYWKEVHHVRMFRPGELEAQMQRYNLICIQRRRLRFITNIELIIGFMSGRHIANQEGVFDRPLPFVLSATLQLFNTSLFSTRLRYIPLWIITIPIAYILDFIFPKTIQYIFCKKPSSH